MRVPVTLAAVIAIAIGATTACGHKHAPKPFDAKYFTDWGDGHRVICALGADRTHKWKLAQLEASLDYAATQKLVLHTSGHAPTFDLDEYADAFAYAHDRGVAFVTYKELVDRTPRAGWAFSIDDEQVDTWYSWRDRLRAWGVHLTFFVSHFDQLTPAQIHELHELAADGHDIEPHGLNHIEAKAFTETYPVAQYIVQDILPDNALFTANLFSTVAFAYPFGRHTPETDRALLEHYQFVRTTQGNCE